MIPYKLSLEAEHDLGEIFDYTAEEFGMEQAVTYVTGFEPLFENLSKFPKTGRLRPEIRRVLRSISYESHVVFYRIVKDHILIVRILHASRDVARFFK